MLNKNKELNNITNKVNCNKCNKKFKLGKPKAYRYFWDNKWEFYECGGSQFWDADYTIPPKHFCGDCYTHQDEGIPYKN